MKYIKRTTKKNRQELLEKALREELTYLRKKIYPYKRHDLLLDEVVIEEKEFSWDEEGRTLGLYEYDEDKQIHKIFINKYIVLGAQKVRALWGRKEYYNDIKQIIRHELIHAFTHTWEWRCKSYISCKNRDASPIFLSILHWVGGRTHHDCFRGFQHTDLYKKISQFKTYKELKDYLEDYLLEYMEVINQIKEITNKDRFAKNEELNYFSITNEFEFAPRANGLEKLSEITSVNIYKKDKEYKNSIITNRIWYVGCNIAPNQLLNLYNKKQDCKAKYYNNKKQLIIMPECAEVSVKDLKTVTIREEKNF